MGKERMSTKVEIECDCKGATSSSNVRVEWPMVKIVITEDFRCEFYIEGYVEHSPKSSSQAIERRDEKRILPGKDGSQVQQHTAVFHSRDDWRIRGTEARCQFVGTQSLAT